MHNNTVYVLAIVLGMTGFAGLIAAGCGTPTGAVVTDAAPADASVIADAAVLADSGTDGGGIRDAAGDMNIGDDAFAGQDGGVVTEDAGLGTDAAPTVDTGTDAYVIPMDAGIDGGPARRGDVVQLGVSGNNTCVLTSTHQMWCWGGTMTTPTRVADAVALEGTCAIALDGHVFCIGSDFPGTDATIVSASPGTYVRRADGVLVAGTAMWTPTSPAALPTPQAIDALPAENCGLFAGGYTQCWDVYPAPFGVTNVTYLHPGENALDVARAGELGAATFRACLYHVPSSSNPMSIYCFTSRGTTGSTAFNNGTEIEMAGGRVCTILSVDTGSGTTLRGAGVYCVSDITTDLAASGYHAFIALMASDPVGAYTNIVGTQLRVGTSHACILHAGAVMCWGDGSSGQLGGAATTRTPVMVF